VPRRQRRRGTALSDDEFRAVRKKRRTIPAQGTGNRPKSRRARRAGADRPRNRARAARANASRNTRTPCALRARPGRRLVNNAAERAIRMAKVKASGLFRAQADAEARRRIPGCLDSMKASGTIPSPPSGSRSTAGPPTCSGRSTARPCLAEVSGCRRRLQFRHEQTGQTTSVSQVFATLRLRNGAMTRPDSARILGGRPVRQRKLAAEIHSERHASQALARSRSPLCRIRSSVGHTPFGPIASSGRTAWRPMQTAALSAAGTGNVRSEHFLPRESPQQRRVSALRPFSNILNRLRGRPFSRAAARRPCRRSCPGTCGPSPRNRNRSVSSRPDQGWPCHSSRRTRSATAPHP